MVSQTEDYDFREVIKQREIISTEETKMLFRYKCPWQ